MLGCWGQELEGLVFCPSIKNVILDITEKTERNKIISDYLDSNFNLFDKPLYYNVHTAVYGLNGILDNQIEKLFSENLFKCIEGFCIVHAKCGLFLRLELKENS